SGIQGREVRESVRVSGLLQEFTRVQGHDDYDRKNGYDGQGDQEFDEGKGARISNYQFPISKRKPYGVHLLHWILVIRY
ncbi:MAG: hypothetical protein LiPW15_500, partial [Parcubacteria group bacterium LiPW_15]